MTLVSQYRVLSDLLHERDRQDVKWGEQHHPDGTGGEELIYMATAAKRVCDKHAEDGTVTWFDILNEEFREAMAESHPKLLREELIQVAAVAIAWIEDIDSRSESPDSRSVS
jgi:hypothetical protein